MCIYLPTTIRISRHDHRLSFTFSLPDKKWFCGVCRKSVDENYGEYSCVKGCNYVVHSKCGTRRDLWDGEELEGIPEGKYEDNKMFKEIDEGIIEYFSHLQHYMRLEKKELDSVDGETKWCQVCIFPIYEGNIYSCMKCDFILHETCAHLPGKKWHQLHPHPLTLQVDHEHGEFSCKTCRNDCNGFKYTCSKEYCYFSLDVRCALIAEPFDHRCHPHSLFLFSGEDNFKRCSICVGTKKYLECIECEFVLCFGCATLPYKMKYIHDEHYLTLSFQEAGSCNSWCEICEKETNKSSGLYVCNVCNVVLHINCLLGGSSLMKHGEIVKIYGKNMLIVSNDRQARPVCEVCRNYCPYRIVFRSNDGKLYCSRRCIER